VGIILDSSVIIAAERRGHTVLEILEQVKSSQGEIEVGVSVVSIAELVHGAYRAKTEAQQQRGWNSSSGCRATFRYIQ
jgi:predicted nucleic acid-binding protein